MCRDSGTGGARAGGHPKLFADQLTQKEKRPHYLLVAPPKCLTFRRPWIVQYAILLATIEENIRGHLKEFFHIDNSFGNVSFLLKVLEHWTI